MTLASQLALFTARDIDVRQAETLNKRVQDDLMAPIYTHQTFTASMVGKWAQVHKNVLQFDGSASGTAPVGLDQIYAIGNSEPLKVGGCGTYAQFRLVYAADGGTDPIIQVIGLDAAGELQLLYNTLGTIDCALVRDVGSPDLQDSYASVAEYYTTPGPAQTFHLWGAMAIIVVVKTIASEVGTVECKLT